MEIDIINVLSWENKDKYIKSTFILEIILEWIFCYFKIKSIEMTCFYKKIYINFISNITLQKNSISNIETKNFDLSSIFSSHFSRNSNQLVYI